MASKVFVGNLNFKTTKENLESLFSQAGKVEEVIVPTDREQGRPRGFAFVQFANDDEAKDAITRFNGYELDGRALRVNAAEDRPRRAPSARPSFGGGGGGGRREEFVPDYGGDGGWGGGGGDYGGGGGYGGGKSKGSRRNIRGKKRSL